MRIDLNSPLVSALVAAPKLKELEVATKKVEGIFVKQLMEQMEKGTKVFGDGPQAEIYADFFNQAIADAASSQGSLQLGKLLYRQLAPRVIAEALPSPTEKS